MRKCMIKTLIVNHIIMDITDVKGACQKEDHDIPERTFLLDALLIVTRTCKKEGKPNMAISCVVLRK